MRTNVDYVSEFIRAYNLRPGDAVPQKGRLAFSVKHGLEYDKLTQLLNDAAQLARLKKTGIDDFFVV